MFLKKVIGTQLFQKAAEINKLIFEEDRRI